METNTQDQIANWVSTKVLVNLSKTLSTEQISEMWFQTNFSKPQKMHYRLHYNFKWMNRTMDTNKKPKTTEYSLPLKVVWVSTTLLSLTYH